MQTYIHMLCKYMWESNRECTSERERSFPYTSSALNYANIRPKILLCMSVCLCTHWVTAFRQVSPEFSCVKWKKKLRRLFDFWHLLTTHISSYFQLSPLPFAHIRLFFLFFAVDTTYIPHIIHYHLLACSGFVKQSIKFGCFHNFVYENENHMNACIFSGA